MENYDSGEATDSSCEPYKLELEDMDESLLFGVSPVNSVVVETQPAHTERYLLDDCMDEEE